MALNLDLWSDTEIIKDAISLMEKPKLSNLLIGPVLRIMKKIRKNNAFDLRSTFNLWVPDGDVHFYVVDPMYPDYLEPIQRNAVGISSWASFQPARVGWVFQDQDYCVQVSKMLQIMGKLANIAKQQNGTVRDQRWVLISKNGHMEIMESDFSNLVQFSSRKNAQLAWETLTEEEQDVFCKGF